MMPDSNKKITSPNAFIDTFGNVLEIRIDVFA